MIQRLLAGAHYLLGFQGAGSLQNIHPLLIHFPIAFLIGSVLLYVLSWIARKESWAWIGLWLLTLGTISAAAAVWTGLAASASVMIAPSVRQHILIYHRAVMLVVFALSIALSLWALAARPMPQRGRGAFLALLLVMAALITAGTDFGAWMVYGYNAGGSLPQPIEFSQ
ncbi:MAG: DUF2231 domain-containing protein [Candidatus Binataceae bacterium]